MSSEDQQGVSLTEAQQEQYEKLINRLKEERDAVQELVDRDYKEVRRYVRAHPEQGVIAAFVGGMALGLVLGKFID